jgi:two-component system, chemotaxis family, sensor kinase CheA
MSSNAASKDLRGTIEVDSVRGSGTTITLKIPLTLAIIESLLVKIGDSHFVLPLAAVEECVELTREDVQAAHGRNLAIIRGNLDAVYLAARTVRALTAIGLISSRSWLSR